MTHKDSNSDNLIQAEHDAIDEAELIDRHHIDEAQPEEALAAEFAHAAGVDETIPAELAAMHTDTDTVVDASGELAENSSTRPVGGDQKTESIRLSAKQGKQKSEKKSAEKVTPAAVKAMPKRRSDRYQAQIKKIDPKRVYSMSDGVTLVKDASYAKFDASVDCHIHLAMSRGKKDKGEHFRAMVVLPHGSGKEPNIGILDEALIEQIKKRGDTEFDILLAPPALMPKVAQIAKILGPKGKMPNPKTGTVTDHPEDAKRSILSGRTEIRADSDSNIHQAIGRVSWPKEKLQENLQALVAVLPRHRLRRVTIVASMGPGIPIVF